MIGQANHKGWSRALHRIFQMAPQSRIKLRNLARRQSHWVFARHLEDDLPNRLIRMFHRRLSNSIQNTLFVGHTLELVGIFFFHPFLPIELMEQTVEGMRNLGYTFVSPTSL